MDVNEKWMTRQCGATGEKEECSMGRRNSACVDGELGLLSPKLFAKEVREIE